MIPHQFHKLDDRSVAFLWTISDECWWCENDKCVTKQLFPGAEMPVIWLQKKKEKKKKEKKRKKKIEKKKVWRVAILLPILSNISFCIVEVITTDGWSWGRIKVLIKTIDWIMIWRMILRLTVLQWFTIELNRKFLKNFKILKKKAGWNSSIGYSTVPNSKKLKL